MDRSIDRKRKREREKEGRKGERNRDHQDRHNVPPLPDPTSVARCCAHVCLVPGRREVLEGQPPCVLDEFVPSLVVLEEGVPEFEPVAVA